MLFSVVHPGCRKNDPVGEKPNDPSGQSVAPDNTVRTPTEVTVDPLAAPVATASPVAFTTAESSSTPAPTALATNCRKSSQNRVNMRQTFKLGGLEYWVSWIIDQAFLDSPEEEKVPLIKVEFLVENVTRQPIIFPQGSLFLADINSNPATQPISTLLRIETSLGTSDLLTDTMIQPGVNENIDMWFKVPEGRNENNVVFVVTESAAACSKSVAVKYYLREVPRGPGAGKCY